jgi:hypothetical protein
MNETVCDYRDIQAISLDVDPSTGEWLCLGG